MNTLIISNPNQFDDDVWQYPTEFDEKQYNDWLQGAIKELQTIYDTYDSGDTDEHVVADIYILGDIINMLSTTKIKVKGERKELD